jgi:hypothetical protein
LGTLSNQRTVDPVLTNIARGFTNASLIGTKLFPIVEVEKEGGKIPQFNKDSFKIFNTERAIRAKSNRISPELKSTIDFVLEEHDLEYPMDYREIDEDATPLKIYATHVVTDGISLRLEKLIADIVQNLSTFPSGNKVTLSSSDQFDNSSSDPFDTFDTAKESIRSKIAKRPNVCVIGAASYNALKKHPAVLDRIKYTERAVVTAELLRQLLEFDQLYVGDAVYADDNNNFVDVWSDNAIVAYIPTANSDLPRSVYEPSFAYTLRKKGNPLVDTYNESGKVQLVRNTDIFIPKVVGSDAGYLINDTNS